MRNPSGTTVEPLLNAELAALLRRRGFDTAALAEQAVRGAGGELHRVDILVEMSDRAVAIEAEFAPARTLRDDAEKRLPDPPLRWRGLPVRSVFAVTYPEALRTVDEGRARASLPASTLSWRHVFRDGSGRLAADSPQEGKPGDLAIVLHNHWMRTDARSSVERTVEIASRAIDTASESLRRAPGFAPESEEEDPAATTALVWLNALLFQELLAADLRPETLPPPHRGKRVARPEARPSAVLRQWDDILAINWWPIFAIAHRTLERTPAPADAHALAVLREAAREIAETGDIRRHDIAGRVYHRLLNSRKFLATNYTTIPAAVLLAALAFDPAHPRWRETRWDDPEDVGRLRIVDPACGTGTLLMAALQEILSHSRRSRAAEVSPEETRDLARAVLERVLRGYDVVPGAVHLTAATLSMAESSQTIRHIQVFRMPHDVKDGRARLGSLDFLKSSAGGGEARALPLLPEGDDPALRTGTGETERAVNLPSPIDLVIANPPYTRAGGPGDADNTEWNPIFGSVLSAADARAMKEALRKTLARTPATVVAGLGSAFLALADERLGPGGRLAIVLPAALVTGSSWRPLRAMLLRNYDLEWVVASHDPRHRTKTATTPGRRHVSFSESTRIAEVLVVATKREAGAPKAGYAKFANLRRNIDNPLAAMAVSRGLLAAREAREPAEILTGEDFWGEVVPVRQADLDDGPWIHASFVQGRLADAALGLARTGALSFRGLSHRVPIRPLGEICAFGPGHIQVKNAKFGLFDAIETDDPARAGEPALWRHKAERIGRLETRANARLRPRAGRSGEDRRDMLARAGRLHLAADLGHAPQRLAAVRADEPMLGFSSWIGLAPRVPAPGKEEALCLWLNTAPGLLLRIAHANRPYLGRSRLTADTAAGLPALDVDRLSGERLAAAARIYEDLKGEWLQGFARLAEDPVRRRLGARLAGEVLGAPADLFDALARALSEEPTMTARH